ncbi:MAG: cell envelope integrity EipB family protein [Rhizobiaceae bacterium]
MKNRKTLSAHLFACALTLPLLSFQALPADAAGVDGLLPHRAVYDLSLIKASDRSGITGMNGRIVYEVTGNKCDGFAVRFRFLTEVQTARKSFTNDQRTSSFESGNGQSFSFVNQSYLNNQLEQDLRGKAARKDGKVLVDISKPDPAEIELGDAIFMTEHVGMLIEAAQDQQSFVTAKVFDGSDKGDELVDTTAVIGKRRAQMVDVEGEPGEVSKQFSDRAAWPISVSYFSTTHSAEQGERLPIYQVSFIMHESGISRDLKMIYDDYSLKGDLTQIEFLEQEACE